MNAVINVDCKDSCFKYALLSTLHYNDITHGGHRYRASKYKSWHGELDFDDIDPSHVLVKNVAKI